MMVFQTRDFKVNVNLWKLRFFKYHDVLGAKNDHHDTHRTKFRTLNTENLGHILTFTERLPRHATLSGILFGFAENLTAKTRQVRGNHEPVYPGQNMPFYLAAMAPAVKTRRIS